MELNIYVFLLIIFNIELVVADLVCPKQCDCDVDNGLNRAVCVDQNIISIDVGVPNAVQVYSLSHNVISELDNFCFKRSGYTAISILNLSYNLIFWIGLHAFAGLNELVHLDLSNNRLRYVPSDLFWDTPLLNTLDLSSNVFETLKNEPLLMHTNLEVLNLNNCRIKALPKRVFTRLPNLKKLDLSENYMVTLNTEVLRPLRKLARLELQNIYWQCNPDFIAVETWIISKNIMYDKQCNRLRPKMSEKMISSVVNEEKELDLNKIWSIKEDKNETDIEEPKTPLTPLQKFDRDFSAIQAILIGLEVGLALGIVGTYVWLRGFRFCRLNCTRPETRRQRRRQRREGDMRANLLWNSVINPNLETPPLFRRQLSLPERDGAITYGLPVTQTTALQVDAIRLPNRPETPPPPYNECRINI